LSEHLLTKLQQAVLLICILAQGRDRRAASSGSRRINQWHQHRTQILGVWQSLNLY